MIDDINQEEIDADRCIALTASGERCSRPAGDDGFCYQHDEEDETVLDAITADGGESDLAGELAALTARDEESSEGNGDGEAAEADEGEEASAEGEAGSTEEETAADEVAESTEEDEGAETSDGEADLGTIRGRVEENASELVGRPVDGVASIHAEDGGWIAVVELVERPAVPDTQDIIGRYEVDVDDGGNIKGYDRLERYRRGDTKAFE